MRLKEAEAKIEDTETVVEPAATADAPATSDADGPGAANADPPATSNGHAIVDQDALREQVLEALKNVHDPELGINIVDLGLVYSVDIDGDTVNVTYSLTTMGCPIGPLIEAEMRQFLSGVDGIENVNAELVLRPPWTPEMMSEEAKAALGFF